MSAKAAMSLAQPPAKTLPPLPNADEYITIGSEEAPAVLPDLHSHGVKIRELRERGNSLEDLFT